MLKVYDRIDNKWLKDTRTFIRNDDLKSFQAYWLKLKGR